MFMGIRNEKGLTLVEILISTFLLATVIVEVIFLITFRGGMLAPAILLRFGYKMIDRG